MANQLGTRKDGTYDVVFLFPSIELNPAYIPTPFPVQYTLGSAKKVSGNVFYNEKKAYIEASDTKAVEGDKLGVHKGVIVHESQTAGTTFPGSYSPSVYVNGRHAHRTGDMHWMVIPDTGGMSSGIISDLVKGALGDFMGVDLDSFETIGNTIGMIIVKPYSPGPTINLDGKIEVPNHKEDLDALWTTVGNVMIGAGVSMLTSGLAGMAGSVASALSGGVANGAPSSVGALGAVAAGAVGSRFGSPVVLSTAQSFHNFTFYPLEGLLPLNLELTYVNRANLKGMFGFDRACGYEKRFTKTMENHYKLTLPDGRWFAFTYVDQSDSFKDHGGLGVQIAQVDEKTFRLRYLDGITETYTYGLLTRIEDIRYPDNAIAIGYLKHPKVGARIAWVKNTQDAKFRFTYNSAGLVAQIEDHGEGVWECIYDAEGYLLQLLENGTLVEQYDYFNIEATAEDEHYLYRVYNTHKEVQLGFEYHDNGTVRSYTDKAATYTYTWHKSGDIEKVDKANKRHVFRLDKHGMIQSILYPDGSKHDSRYDEAAKKLTESTRGNNLKITTFDEQKRVLSVAMNDEIIDRFVYEGDNPQPVIHTKYHQETKYSYDENWHLLTLTKPNAATEQFSYTSQGLLARHSDAHGAQTTYKYDEKQRRVEVINPLGLSTLFVYDSYGRVKNSKNPRKEERRFSYNQRHQLTQTINDMEEQMDFSYTPTGKLASITDSAGRTTTFTYDVYDRLSAKRYPDGSKEQYVYHDNDTLKEIQRVDGTSLFFGYDDNANITEIKAYQPDNQEHKAQSLSLHYAYDTLGNLTEALTPTHAVTLTYDAYANISNETQGAHTLLRHYSPNHDLEALQFLYHRQSFTYDSMGMLAQVHHGHVDVTIDLDYDKAGRLTQKSLPNAIEVDYSYDDASQLEKQETKHYNHNATTLPLLHTQRTLTHTTQLQYERDRLGRVSRILDSDIQDPIDFTYNQREELIETQSPQGITHFSYDAAGNLTSRTSSGSVSDTQDDAYVYNSANHLLESPSHTYTYDARGNLKSKTDKDSGETTVYTFNLFDQLMEVKHYQSNRQQNLIEKYTYIYDALNRRIGKSYTNTQKKHKDFTHVYLYHHQSIIAILDKEENVLATLTHADTIDTPLSITNELTQETYYYHSTHQGSITHLTDAVGNIVESFTYDAYGTILEHTQSEETHNPYCYTAREWDREDLYYYRARYYDPSIGRFISQDPIEFLAGDFNFYRYVGNDPVNWVDPSGLAGRSPRGRTPSTKGKKGRYNPVAENSKAVTNMLEAIFGKTAKKPAIPPKSKGSEGVSGGGGLSIIKPENKPLDKNKMNLNKQVGSKEQLGEINSGKGTPMAGKGHERTLRDSPRLEAQHGGKAEDWSKVKSSSRTHPDGTTTEIHAYENKTTGKVVEHKTKIQTKKGR